MTALVLQARLDSSRLPRKALLPLGGPHDEKPLLSRVMEALKAVPAAVYVLACPEDCAETFAPLAREADFELVSGPKDDVLARYCVALRRFRADRVIRATGDNPFVFADAAAAINAEAEALGADYAGYAALPYGAGVESVAAEALFRAEAEAKLPAEREHVCPYLYGNPDLFRLHRPLAPKRWQRPDIRLTVDTAADLEHARRLWAALSPLGEQTGEAIIAAAENL